jgi:putative methionine-R-sulfoxide reductase with GAF domain
VPGHIACDPSTESEIVVPLEILLPGTSGTDASASVVVGVLDIDCQRADSWSNEDEDGLRRIVAWLVQEDGVVGWHNAIKCL